MLQNFLGNAPLPAGTRQRTKRAIYWVERPDTGAKSPFNGAGEAARWGDGVALGATASGSSVSAERTANNEPCVQGKRGDDIGAASAAAETATGLVMPPPIIGPSLAT